MFEGTKSRIAARVTEFLRYWSERQRVWPPKVDSTATIASSVIVDPAALIGRRTHINGPGTLIDTCEIGAFCSISWGVTIGAGGHPMEAASTHFFWIPPEASQRRMPPTKIGNDVWIGCNATVVSGVTIGDGAVVGAGAVVTHDVPPYGIVVGVPARLLRYRFDEGIRAELQGLRWWTWSDTVLEDAKNAFDDPSNLIAFARRRQLGG